MFIYFFEHDSTSSDLPKCFTTAAQSTTIPDELSKMMLLCMIDGAVARRLERWTFMKLWKKDVSEMASDSSLVELLRRLPGSSTSLAEVRRLWDRCAADAGKKSIIWLDMLQRRGRAGTDGGL